ncbi:MAG: DUF481 domain-containing protein [Oligoflexus sp.]
MSQSVWRLIIILLFSFIFFQDWCLGQIVNVAQIANRDVKEGFSLSTDLSWERKQGNIDLSVLTAKATSFYRHSDHLLLLILEREYGVQNSSALSDRAFQHLRYRYQWLERVTLETFAQHDRNQFRRLKSRTLIGAGPRFQILATENHLLHLGLAPMKEIEVFEEASTLTDEPLVSKRQEDIRLSLSLGYHFNLAENLSFSNTGYWQPLADDLDIYRLLNDAALTIQITEILALRFSATLTHDTNPPPGIRQTDHHYKNALVINF